MLSLPASVSVYLWLELVDMRKGFDGLGNLIRTSHNIFEGDLFIANTVLINNPIPVS